jgi:c-di-GMP-specific phosphodiesterase
MAMNKSADALALEAELQAGVASGAFEPAFQPVARLADGALAGFEALARWRRVSGALAPTGVFLESALEQDLLGQISLTILFAACTQLAQWRRTVPQAEHLFLSVNVAGRDLERGALQADVEAALSQSGLPGHALRLEVTEHQVLADPARAAATLKAVRALGVKVLLDDFGAGYASLHWLMRLPVDAIKYDPVIVQGVGVDGPERKILRAMTGLAHELGLSVIAEGVETQAQRDALFDMGCDYAQGYLFAQALNPADAMALISALGAQSGAA